MKGIYLLAVLVGLANQTFAADVIDRRDIGSDIKAMSCPSDPEEWMKTCGWLSPSDQVTDTYIIATRPDEGFPRSDNAPNLSNTLPVDEELSGGPIIWAETEVATLSFGYDPATNRTLLKVYNITAIGPNTAFEAVKNVFKQCATASLAKAKTAFYDAQPPEIGYRIGREPRWIMVASPRYLDDAPLLENPSDLSRHRCIGLRIGTGALYKWELGSGDRELSVDEDWAIIVNETELAIEIAEAGGGIAYCQEGRVAKQIRDGSLREVLPTWSSVGPTLNIYYPSRRQMPEALRALIGMIRNRDRDDRSD